MTLRYHESSCAHADLVMDFELRVISLDSEPDYTALPYVWGDPTDTEQISVNKSGIFVTKNLASALRTMQYLHVRPAIWIYAVCIDQINVEEKSEQVPKMNQIYSRARRVLVWLGPGYVVSDVAIDILCLVKIMFDRWFKKWFPSQLDWETHHSLKYDEAGRCVHGTCEVLDFLSMVIGMWPGLGLSETAPFSDRNDFMNWHREYMMELPWFRRVWTIQEFLLASSCSFQLGIRMIDSEHMVFLNEVAMCLANFEAGKQPFQKPAHFLLAQLLTPGTRQIGQFGLVDFLVHAYCGIQRSLGCQDKRDRLFGLAGIVAKDFKTLGLTVGYDRPPQEVFIELAMRLYESGEFDILSLCQQQLEWKSRPDTKVSDRPENGFEFPSWAPDWSKDMRLPHGWFKSNERTRHFSASGDTKAKASCTYVHSGGPVRIPVMNVAGVFIGEVMVIKRGRYGLTKSATDEGVFEQERKIQEVLKASQAISFMLYSSVEHSEAPWRLPVWDMEFIIHDLR